MPMHYGFLRAPTAVGIIKRSLTFSRDIKKPIPLCDRFETFIFDCDGVIWKGDQLIDGADLVIRKLYDAGKNVFFMTNNSLKTRQDCRAKFAHFNISVPADNILCSAFAAARYLSSKGFSGSDKKVYVIGEHSIMQELSLMNITTIGGPDFNGHHVPISRDLHVEVNPDISAVVVGCDRQFSYYKLLYGQLCLLTNPSSLFVATNTDMVKHLTSTQEYVGAGAMVAAMTACSGRTPIVTGKPNPFIIDYISDKYRLKRSSMCMVGDRLDTDIIFGIKSGIHTCLTLTGCTTRDQVEHPLCTIQPDYIVHSISALI